MARKISYGVLVLNEHGELLLAHVTGQNHWDIPKGGADPGESPIEAALRETLEETGLTLEASTLKDLGQHPYLPSKDLHLFRTLVSTSDYDIAGCHCTTFFPHHRTGAPTPEVDAFQWIALEDIPRYCSARLSAVLEMLLT